MTKAETVKLFTLISMVFPKDKTYSVATPEKLAPVVETWTRILADIPYEVAEAAVQEHAVSSPFVPAICDIAQFYAKVKCPRLEWEDAYKQARDARRKYGWPDPQGAKEALMPEVWQAVTTMYGTWEGWCTNDDPEGVERAQFKDIWVSRQARKQQAAALPQGVAEVMKMASGMCALPE